MLSNNKLKSFLALSLIIFALCLNNKQADAQVAGVPPQLLPFVALAPGAYAVAATTAATAALPVALGAVAFGAFVYGAVYVYDNADSIFGKTVVKVNSQDLANQPNPDLQTASPAAVSEAYQVVRINHTLAEFNPFLYIPYTTCGSTPTNCAYTRSNAANVYQPFYNQFYLPLQRYLVENFGIDPAKITSAAIFQGNSTSTYCSSTTTSPAYSPAGRCLEIRYDGIISNLKANAMTSYETATNSLYYFQLSSSAPAYTCPSDSYWDTGVNLCILKAEALQITADGICNVSFNTPGSRPAFNKTDPDCALVDSKISLSPGTQNQPPKVQITDPNTGNTLTVERNDKSTQAGTIEQFKVTETVPNHTAGITQRTTAVAQPANPAATPQKSGLNSDALPGTGPGTGANPISQVTVQNWPSNLNVTCSNCTSTAPVVNIPDTFKIDNEGAPGVLDEIPDAEEPQGISDVLLDAINPFKNIELDSHPASCPTIGFSGEIFPGAYISPSTNFHCQLLEGDFKIVIQGMITILIMIGAVRIVLDA